MGKQHDTTRRFPLLLVAAAIVALFCFLTGEGQYGKGTASAAGVEEVKREFEEICANSTNGTPLAKEQLAELIKRCDKLKPRIEELEDTEHRFYKRRLKSCRDLYQFMIDTAEQQQTASTPTATFK